MGIKFELFKEAGVQEYWIVDSAEKVIWQYQLENNQFTNHKPLIEDDTIQSKIITGLKMDLFELFNVKRFVIAKFYKKSLNFLEDFLKPKTYNKP